MATQNTLSKANVSVETGSKSLGTATIKASNSSHIVQVLVNTMYANKEASSVREILSNAIDSHNMSKNKKDKVEIQVPTKTFPMLRIRDFGTGLSPEYMANEYLSLGHSEKRNRNDAVGFMGLGRFALFSLFKSYFVTSYYKGKKYPYTIHLDENGDIALKIIEEEIVDTDEKSGLEVFVLIDDENRMKFFQSEILKLTFFCKDKVDLVNYDEDEIPSWYYQKPIYEFGNITIYEDKNSYLRGCFNLGYGDVLMGVYDNIPYQISKDFITMPVQTLVNKFKSTSLIAINLPIGSVERTASREGLERDKYNKTIDALGNMSKEAEKEIEKFKKKICSDIKTYEDLLTVSENFFKVFESYQVISWVSPNKINHSVNNVGFVSDIFRLPITGFHINSKGRLLKSVESVSNWKTFHWKSNTIFIKNNTPDEKEVNVRAKIKKYMTDNTETSMCFMFDEETADVVKFLDEINHIELSTLEKPKAKKSDKPKEILCFHTISENYGGYNGYTLESLNVEPSYFKDCIVVYFECKSKVLTGIPDLFNARQGVRDFLRFTRNLGGNVQVQGKTISKFYFCGLSERNVQKVKKLKNFYTWTKFEKSLPKLIPLNEDHFNTGVKQIINSKINILRNWEGIVQDKRLKDKELISYFKEFYKIEKKYGNERQVHVIHPSILKLYKQDKNPTQDLENLITKIEYQIDKYPLIKNMYNFANFQEDCIIYINAKYEPK